MSRFIHENFLLGDSSAVRLYHEYAADMPILDYHCHLPPQQVADDHRFENLTQIWLAGDHYKWRAMRAAGIDERYITGNASDWEKFEKWAGIVPLTLRNPLYHWTHLELNRPFGINDRLLHSETARSIWDECNAKLVQPEFSARGIMRQMNVRVVCTTDDPVDSLDAHRQIADDASFDIKVLPTFRPDRIFNFSSLTVWNDYITRLGESAGIDISTFDKLLEAIKIRHDFFHTNGCRLSDHGFGLFEFSDWTQQQVKNALDALRRGNMIPPQDRVAFQSAVMFEVGCLNCERNWAMQLHIGAMRNNRTKLFETIGPDIGADSMIDGAFAVPLSQFLDSLDKTSQLPRTIIYNLNPTANDMLATMIGNFQDGKTPGKLQFGSGWWFLDQKYGMEQQIESLSNQGLLALFVGMLTDSRSFLSYTRHEYFRRVLCNLLGREMQTGLLPNDFELVGGMVRSICYHNAARYIGFE
jgi:glucuronate isomerase